MFGNICTGQSFTQMEERCALLNMPIMSSSTYFSVQKDIHNKIRDVALEEMKDAVKIEKELAIERDSVDKHGIPLLTVVVDGSWAKRSYKCNYSSLSGVVSVKTDLLAGNIIVCLYVAILGMYSGISFPKNAFSGRKKYILSSVHKI